MSSFFCIVNGGHVINMKSEAFICVSMVVHQYHFRVRILTSLAELSNVHFLDGSSFQQLTQTFDQHHLN